MNSTLDNYINSMIKRLLELLKNEELLLIRYNKIFNDKKEETLKYLYLKYRTMYYMELKNANINYYDNCIKYDTLYKKIIIKYYEDKLNNLSYSNRGSIKKNIMDSLKNENKVISYFDLQLARTGTNEEKKYEMNILKNELSYIINDYKNKYVFYDEKEKVDDKINSIYNGIINGYLKGTSKKIPSSYVRTRMMQCLSSYEEKSKRKFKLNDMEYHYAKQCMPIIKNYIINNNLSNEKLFLFLDYCKNAFNNYINKGYYEENIKIMMIKAIEAYDEEFIKEVIKIKTLKKY